MKSKTGQHLEQLMSFYTVDNLVNIGADEFERYIKSLPGTRDESLPDLKLQRDASVEFVWGHNHDFGTFQMKGAMGDRHLDLMTTAIDELGFPLDLIGQNVLDIGCWTGGTGFLLSKMKARRVAAIDEVKMYTDAVNTVNLCFSDYVTGITKSVYDLGGYGWHDFDTVVCLGVLYHLSDPIVALRIMFNCLRDGGILLLESAVNGRNDFSCGYRGPQSMTKWNWFVPSFLALQSMCEDVGFQIEETVHNNKRAMLLCKRVEYRGMLRAGLSRKDV